MREVGAAATRALATDPRPWFLSAVSFGHSWGAFGFAVLDIDGPTVTVCYRVNGAQPVVASETIALG